MSRFLFPKPISEDSHVFESLVCDVFTHRLGCENLQRYGRRGQSQNGVDIAGYNSQGIIGIQCKHHPESTITIREIDNEIAKAEHFTPKLSKFYIVTSANTEKKIQSHVAAVMEQRKANGQFPVEITFWEELKEDLDRYPQLAFKYFQQFFSTQALEHVLATTEKYPSKHTLSWRVKDNQLAEGIAQTTQSLTLIEPYHLTLGITSFSDIHYSNIADLEIDLSEFVADELAAKEGFIGAAEELSLVKQTVSAKGFGREISVHLNLRLPLALLVGWTFRKVSGYQLKLHSNGQVWATDGLPDVVTNLTDNLPIVFDTTSTEIAVVLSISRDIHESVLDFIEQSQSRPNFMLVWRLEGNKVRSAAHALSLAIEISRKLKAVMDSKQVRHIHLFGALPAALATLIAHNLNAICHITIYFLDSSRQQYLPSGTLHNQL
jgi:hypothetical protein